MSKGSRARPFSISQKDFDANWDKIFGGNKMTPKVTKLKKAHVVVVVAPLEIVVDGMLYLKKIFNFEKNNMKLAK